MAEANEITKCNYEEGLSELIELIKMSDFVSVDATVETTGFLLPDETFNSAYMSDVDDWVGAWYDTLKSKEKSHCLLEIGVAVFKRVPSNPLELEVEVFNVPCLPACVDDNEIARFRGRTSSRLQFDGYAQEFIKKSEFDMNKVLYLAAPYLNRQLQEQADVYMSNNPKFMVATRKRRLNLQLMPEIFEEVTEKERKTIIERLKGVSKVFESISQCAIPVIGHHLLLKLILIYKDFFEYLPDTYAECVDKINKHFKVVYDTKQMTSDLYTILHQFSSQVPFYVDRIKPGNECNLYELVRNLNFVGELSDSFILSVGSRSELYVEDLLDILEGITVEDDTNSFCYVAGFDALTCGVLFLDLVCLMENAKLNVERGQVEMERTTAIDDCLNVFLTGNASHFKNKMYKAPQVPDSKSPQFLELILAKKELCRSREMEQVEKAKQAKEKKLKIFQSLNNYNKNDIVKVDQALVVDRIN